MKVIGRSALSLAAAAALALGLGSVAQAQSLTIDKCQKEIENQGRGIQDKIFKALQLCKDKYRQAVVKVTKLNSDTNPRNDTSLAVELPKATKACDTALAKTIGLSTSGNLNTLGTPPTQVQKTYAKLTGPGGVIAKGKCTDADLAALGHLPEAAYGDAWARWLITAMLKSAYEKQIWLVADLPGIMAAFCDANGNATPGEPAGPTGDCPTCCNLQVPPCNKMNCRLGGSSQTTVNVLGPSVVPLNVPLNGELVSEYCVYPDFIGSDIAVVGNPSRTVDEVPVGSITACVTQLRAEGFIKCGGSSLFNGPANVTLCADGQAGAGPCNAGACLPAGSTAVASCPGTGSSPGPICQQLAAPLAGANDTVVLATLQIETPTAPATCTGAGGNVVPTVLTSQTVTINFSNYDSSVCGGAPFTTSVTGSAGACPSGFFNSQDLTSTLVGGFPAYQSTSGGLGNTATTFTLVCTP